MSITIHDCEQGTEEWYRARMGMPTASEFSTVMAKGRGGEESKTRRTYMLKLAGELITGEPMENYSNGYMERGKIMEAEARSYYTFMNDKIEVKQVGFISDGRRCGCSPDALLGDEGVLEIKTAAPHILADLILRDQFPPEHMAQCQGALFVTDREWLDLLVYWPKFPMFCKRITRDASYIGNLENEIDRFNREMADLVSKVESYGK